MTEDRGGSYQSVWRFLMQVPFRQDYIEAAGLRTRYAQAGHPDRPALVMLHGTGGHWEAFCANIGPLSQHFCCYAVDMMGCGFTDKPDKPYETPGYVEHILAFMDKVGLQRASFIGVSLGSWVATRLALDHPDRVDKLILIAPPGLLPSPPDAGAAVGARRASAIDPSWTNISTILKGLFYSERSMMDDLIAVRQQVYSLPGMDRIMPRMLTLFDPDIRARNNLTEEQWRSIQVPALVVAHVDAPDLYLTSANAVSDLLPNAERVEIHETAHWAQWEQWEAFNRIAIQFLNGGGKSPPEWAS